MLTAIIPTLESERVLVPTLSALVSGSVSGLLSEVIVADGGSRDATAEVADIAGCRFLPLNGEIGARLKSAASVARTPWLLFLPAGALLDPDWMTAVSRFMERTDMREQADRAAVFRIARTDDALRPTLNEMLTLLRAALGGMPKPQQGLLIARRFYDALGGHVSGQGAESALLNRIGRRRISMLPSRAAFVGR